MKKINITIICPGEEKYPGCEDLLKTYPEVNLVACYCGMDEIGLPSALEGSDVLLLDEAVIELEGPEKVRAIHAEYPGIRTLQIIGKSSENSTMTAISLGVRGVLERASLVPMLRKAITVLYSGETWISRDVVQSLHIQSRYLDDRSVWLAPTVSLPGGSKLN